MKIKHKTLTISQNQYLKDIISEVPTNTIIHKKLTGIGATTLEIEAARHSIIIEPNVPVIVGKKKKDKTILDIKEGTSIDDVIDYLLNPKYMYKKLLSTPESFFKIEEACSVTGFNLYTDFFLLFDECDRVVKDSSYRKSITLPMNDFFRFEKKCFISATPLAVSDPRFKEQGFEYIEINPDFSFAKEITLIHTNSTLFSLYELLKTLKGHKVFIFLNSTRIISLYIDRLRIEQNSSIFCSDKAVTSFKYQEKKKAYDQLKTFSQYNFLTSRFFSAVDIDLDYKPVVIMLSDVTTVEHTMIDPKTDAVQIVGRFRNGVQQVYHISTTSEKIDSMSPSETLAYLKGNESAYSTLQGLHLASSDKGTKNAFKEALSLLPYNDYLNEDGSKNHYMYDCKIYDERVKRLYANKDALLETYPTDHFNVTLQEEEYPEDTISRVSLSFTDNYRKMVKNVIEAYENASKKATLFNISGTYDEDFATQVEIQVFFPEIVEGLKVLGKDAVLETFSASGLKNKIAKKKKETERENKNQALNHKINNFSFIEDILGEFSQGDKLNTLTIKNRLEGSIKRNNLDLKPTVKLLEKYFKVSRTSMKTDKGEIVKCYKIGEPLFKSVE